MHNKTRTTLIALGSIAVVAWVWWTYFSSSDFAHEEVRVLPAPAIVPAATAPPTTTSSEPAVAAPVVTASQNTSCRDQRLNISIRERSTTECFGATVVLQNGSVRSYRVDGTKDQRWEFKVEAIGERVQSARLTTGDNLNFACAESNCTGITISKHDSQGVRTITVSRALLRQSSGAPIAEAVSERVAHLEGKLRTLPEAQVPGVACPGQGITIVTSEGGTTALCPSGGAGFEILDDGGRRFEFSGVDTGTIYVTVNSTDALQKVDYENGALACSGAECGGVSIAPANEKGERVFSFMNTTLRETVGAAKPSGRFVVITGTLVLPGDL